jgi:hypothetical protein
MASIRCSVLRDMRDTYARLGFAIPQDVDVALAHGGTWTDANHLLRLHEIDGPATAHEASRRNTASSLTQGAFATLERQALKLFGRRPQAMMRFYPGAYAMAMRDMGTATYADSVNGGRIEITGLPSHVAAHAGYRAGSRGALHGLLERLGWRGDVSEGAVTTSSFAFTMRWWRAAEQTTSHPLER